MQKDYLTSEVIKVQLTMYQNYFSLSVEFHNQWTTRLVMVSNHKSLSRQSGQSKVANPIRS